MSSSLAVTHSSAQASASLPAFWMSPDLVWTVFLLLLGMSLLVSLRYDWLKIWWQDQLRRMTSVQAAEDDLSASFALPEPSRPRSRPQPAPPHPRDAHWAQAARATHPANGLPSRTVHPARAPAHRADRTERHDRSGPHALTPHAGVQRTLFHRSGRRH
jgi:hypothetical protein